MTDSRITMEQMRALIAAQRGDGMMDLVEAIDVRLGDLLQRWRRRDAESHGQARMSPLQCAAELETALGEAWRAASAKTDARIDHAVRALKEERPVLRLVTGPKDGPENQGE